MANAPTVVQYNKAGGGSLATETVTFASTSTIGNRIYVGLFVRKGTAVAPILSILTDNGTTPNTYTAVNGTTWQTVVAGSFDYYLIPYSAPITSLPLSGNIAVTATLTTSQTNYAVSIMEIAGQSSTTPVDTSSIVTASQTSGSTSIALTTTFANFNELGLVFMCPSAAATAAAGWFVQTSGNANMTMANSTSRLYSGSRSFPVATQASGGWLATIIGLNPTVITPNQGPPASTGAAPFPFLLTGNYR